MIKDKTQAKHAAWRGSRQNLQAEKATLLRTAPTQGQAVPRRPFGSSALRSYCCVFPANRPSPLLLWGRAFVDSVLPLSRRHLQSSPSSTSSAIRQDQHERQRQQQLQEPKQEQACTCARLRKKDGSEIISSESLYHRAPVSKVFASKATNYPSNSFLQLLLIRTPRKQQKARN